MTRDTEQIIDNRYRVEDQIGKGGMGSVYRGTHIAIGRRVAIKFLHTEFAQNEELLVRFFREARAAAAIEHKNIIQVLDVGVTEDSVPYLVMEYLEGESLAGMMKRTGPIGVPAACGILESVLSALAAAHKKGIVHRDLKPENIFIVRDPEAERVPVKIIDFGISKFIHMDTERVLTKTGALLGTPTYMSPEQAMGSGDVDHRTDIFAAGVILFEMLTGETPFSGANTRDIICNILAAEPQKGADLIDDFPPEAQHVIDRALSRSPDDRYADAAEMLEALKQLVDDNTRHEQLTLFASKVVNPGCAVGDLGALSTPGNATPEQVLSRIAKERTPSEWTGLSGNEAPRTSAARRYWAIGGGIAFGLVAILAVVLLRHPEDAPPKRQGAILAASKSPAAAAVTPGETGAAPKPQAPVTPPAQTVEISLTGIPSTAAVYLGDKPMASSTFPVPYGREPVPVRVDAAGFERAEVLVVPSEDRTIAVTLSPAPPIETPRTLPTENGPTVEAKSDKPRPSAKPAVPKNVSDKATHRFRKGRRGTEIAEEFK